MKKADIGMIGMAVMGENLSMNMERHGFTVNTGYPYCQPALVPGGDPLPMHLLTTGGACTSAELRAMETLVHTRVYGQASAAEQ